MFEWVRETNSYFCVFLVLYCLDFNRCIKLLPSCAIQLMRSADSLIVVLQGGWCWLERKQHHFWQSFIKNSNRSYFSSSGVSCLCSKFCATLHGSLCKSYRLENSMFRVTERAAEVIRFILPVIPIWMAWVTMRSVSMRNLVIMCLFFYALLF